MKTKANDLTVGRLKRLIENLPDDMLVVEEWEGGTSYGVSPLPEKFLFVAPVYDLKNDSRERGCLDPREDEEVEFRYNALVIDTVSMRD